MNVLTKLAVLNMSMQRQLWVRMFLKNSDQDYYFAICDIPEFTTAGPKDLIAVVRASSAEDAKGEKGQLGVIRVEMIDHPNVEVELTREEVTHETIRLYSVEFDGNWSRLPEFHFAHPLAAFSSSSL